MAAYADYSYYTTTFLGTAIASSEFSRLALRASAQIDRVTFDRAALEVLPATVDKIKMAMCEVAEELKRQETAGGADAITSESVGSYSVAYAANSEKSKTNQAKINTSAKIWLDGTGLLFQGFNSGEYGGEVADE